MIIQLGVGIFTQNLKDQLMTAKELKEIFDDGDGNGNLSDCIDTLEEAMRVYIEYLREVER